jgi:anti-sigma regulatory factor (Ser/Thr protein kinase)
MTVSAPATIRIEAASSALASVRAFVRDQLRATEPPTDEETIADLVQAVDELVCNVIEHGYGPSGGPAAWVETEVAVDAEAIAIRIRDAAPPFDPTAVAEPRLDLPLDRRPLGGMGIHLARSLTDEFRHRILPGGGNEVTVRKRRRTATEASDGDHDRATQS